MDLNDQTDHAEHAYWATYCPACDISGSTHECPEDDTMPTEPITHTYWISIGRNVGDDPATLSVWADFQADARSVFAREHAAIVAEVDGHSTWNGQSEATHLFLVSLRADSVPTLRTRLSHLASKYGQDAIGLVGGPGSSLVSPA